MSIGELGALKELTLQALIKMDELPEGMKRLTGLEVLTLKHCGIPEVRGWIREMEGLQNLSLCLLWDVEELPEEIKRLTRLQNQTERLRVLPGTIGRLRGSRCWTSKEFRGRQRCQRL